MSTRNIHITFSLHVQHNVVTIQKANYLGQVWTCSTLTSHILRPNFKRLLKGPYGVCKKLDLGLTLHTNVIQPTDAQCNRKKMYKLVGNG